VFILKDTIKELRPFDASCGFCRQSVQPQVALVQENAIAGWWKVKAFSGSLFLHRGAKGL
jgi:hypothetical protein